MADRFEYRVCQVQNSRVTFENGVWAGHVKPERAPAQAAFESCPEAWAYLNGAGAEGWELVSAATRVQEEKQVIDVLYLCRRI
ncbi:MAG: hypothetical protein JXA93_14670 [Anaerolineae bacterium]|nr:hypothetical protein [Anaerolineae bacterium]